MLVQFRLMVLSSLARSPVFQAEVLYIRASRPASVNALSQARCSGVVSFRSVFNSMMMTTPYPAMTRSGNPARLRLESWS